MTKIYILIEHSTIAITSVVQKAIPADDARYERETIHFTSAKSTFTKTTFLFTCGLFKECFLVELLGWSLRNYKNSAVQFFLVNSLEKDFPALHFLPFFVWQKLNYFSFNNVILERTPATQFFKTFRPKLVLVHVLCRFFLQMKHLFSLINEAFLPILLPLLEVATCCDAF